MDADSNSNDLSSVGDTYPFRIALYGLITLGVFQGVFMAIHAYGARFMGQENGPIEMTQVVLALVGAAGLFYAAAKAVKGKAGLILCGAVVSYAAARESDLFFETVFFDDAYKVMVGLPMAILVAVTFVKYRSGLVSQTLWLMRQPAATLFALAGIYLCFVCQFFDRPDLWASISQGAEAETTKALIEEYAELFAYLLLAFSGIEATIFAIGQRAALGQVADDTGNEFPRIAA